jgi:tryptophan synthase alpha chain
MLERVFERARAGGRAAFIPYVMCGDPDEATSLALLDALTRNGCDAIELGIPYGDPLADGPTIAAAAVRALQGGTTIDSALDLVREHTSRGGAPIVLFTYFNPIYQYGLERFAQRAADVGAAGVIVPDIALEEGEALAVTLASHGLDMPLLVAPSTTPARAQRIVQQSTGFVYVVSRLGVTGATRDLRVQALRDQINALRAMTTKPLAVGFGVSEPEHVAAIAAIADGIIVGSALIDAYVGSAGDEAAARAGAYVSRLIGAAEVA